MTELFKYSPNEVIVPGETIIEMLEECSMTQKDLADRMELSEQEVVGIIQGKSPITNEYAYCLESIFGMPFSFWLSLQRNYESRVKDL